MLQPEPGQIAFFPVIESVQEFKVEVNSPPAEFGRFNGGVVNLTMKSGTNNLHGTVFEFVRNEALNARNLFAPGTATNPKKPVFRRNQFGFVIGGPIIKDETFFFGDYQGTRQLIARVRISTVPTLVQRQGNFASSLGAPLFLQSNGSISTNVTANPVNVTDTNGNTIQARILSGNLYSLGVNITSRHPGFRKKCRGGDSQDAGPGSDIQKAAALKEAHYRF